MRRQTLLQRIDALPDHDAKRQLQRAHVALESLTRNVSMQVNGLNSIEDVERVKRQTREDVLQIGALMADIGRLMG